MSSNSVVISGGGNSVTSADVAAAAKAGKRLVIDSGVTEGDIVDRIASATSVEDIFGGGELVKVKDILGRSILVTEIEGVRSSDFEGGVGVYLIVKASDSNGETFSVSVGVTDGIVKLLKLDELGALPRWVAFEESTKKTANGYYPINLVDRHSDNAETAGF